MKKKLLIFGYTLEIGGAEKALVDTIKILKDYADIDLYLLEKKGELLKEIPKEVNVYQMKNNFLKYILFRNISFIRKKTINKIASLKNYDYVFSYMEGRCATWACDITKNIKKYAWIHNDVFKFNIGIKDKEIKKSYNNIDKIICVSKESKNNFCQKYNISKDKVSVIYNYIDEDDIIKKAGEFEVKKNKLTFVNVAKMRKQKRQDRLVSAAVKLKEEGFDFEIWLVGDGPELEKIKDMIYTYKVEKFVKVLGLKTNPYPYVKASDYFILSSYMEGYGIVIKEALLLKKRIITTNVVGPKEILENGKYGIIIPNTDEAVYNILKEIMQNNDKYNYLDKHINDYKSDNQKIKKQLLELIDVKGV